MSFDKDAAVTLPAWVPVEARHYLLHTVYGQSIRALARQVGIHPSTVLRQVRRIEARRDDPLVDTVLTLLSEGGDGKAIAVSNLEMLQALRRLSGPGALLAVAPDMETGVIVSDAAAEGGDRGTGLDLRIARALALQDLISTPETSGRVLRYRLTGAGRARLRELIAKSENRAREMAEATTPFAHDDPDLAVPRQRQLRLASSETPVHGLARRRDKDGEPFLSRDMVRAAERLREEFEIAHIGASVSQDWGRFLARGGVGHRSRAPSGSEAREGVERAFAALGPGLAEVVYRTCCLLEGLEQTEREMGWSARSGKIVLRIALQRLAMYYDQSGRFGPKIG